MIKRFSKLIINTASDNPKNRLLSCVSRLVIDKISVLAFISFLCDEWGVIFIQNILIFYLFSHSIQFIRLPQENACQKKVFMIGKKIIPFVSLRIAGG
jgi:hypothetical protein